MLYIHPLFSSLVHWLTIFELRISTCMMFCLCACSVQCSYFVREESTECMYIIFILQTNWIPCAQQWNITHIDVCMCTVSGNCIPICDGHACTHMHRNSSQYSYAFQCPMVRNSAIKYSENSAISHLAHVTSPGSYVYKHLVFSTMILHDKSAEYYESKCISWLMYVLV